MAICSQLIPNTGQNYSFEYRCGFIKVTNGTLVNLYTHVLSHSLTQITLGNEHVSHTYNLSNFPINIQNALNSAQCCCGESSGSSGGSGTSLIEYDIIITDSEIWCYNDITYYVRDEYRVNNSTGVKTKTNTYYTSKYGTELTEPTGGKSIGACVVNTNAGSTFVRGDDNTNPLLGTYTTTASYGFPERITSITIMARDVTDESTDSQIIVTNATGDTFMLNNSVETFSIDHEGILNDISVTATGKAFAKIIYTSRG